jgi:hypothetical protein
MQLQLKTYCASALSHAEYLLHRVLLRAAEHDVVYDAHILLGRVHLLGQEYHAAADVFNTTFILQRTGVRHPPTHPPTHAHTHTPIRHPPTHRREE